MPDKSIEQWEQMTLEECIEKLDKENFAFEFDELSLASQVGEPFRLEPSMTLKDFQDYIENLSKIDYQSPVVAKELSVALKRAKNTQKKLK